MLVVIDRIRTRGTTFAIVVLLIAGMVSVFNSSARAAESQLNFVLVAVDVAPETDGVKPILILSGPGTFTSGAVIGSGIYTYADLATETPKTILSTGTWRATEVLRWTPSEGGATYEQKFCDGPRLRVAPRTAKFVPAQLTCGLTLSRRRGR